MKQMGLDRILVDETALARQSGLSRGGDTDGDPLGIVDIVDRGREKTPSFAGLARIVVHSRAPTAFAIPCHREDDDDAERCQGRPCDPPLRSPRPSLDARSVVVWRSRGIVELDGRSSPKVRSRRAGRLGWRLEQDDVVLRLGSRVSHRVASGREMHYGASRSTCTAPCVDLPFPFPLIEQLRPSDGHTAFSSCLRSLEMSESAGQLLWPRMRTSCCSCIVQRPPL